MSFPRVLAGRRRALVARLVANGLAQAAGALGAARALHAALSSPAPSPALLGVLAAAGVALLALRVHAAGVAERLGQDYVTRVRLRIFEAVAARPARAAQSRTGVTLTRVISDLTSLRRWVSDGIARSVVAIVMLGGALAALAFTLPSAALVLGGVALGCAGVAAALTPLLRAYVREARRRRGRLANNLGEKLLASQTVRQLGRTEDELARVRTHSGWLRDALVRRARLAEAIAALPDFATPLALAVWLGLRGSGHPGTLAAGALMLGVLGGALRDLARALEFRIAFEESRRRIGVLLDAPRLEEKRRAKPLAGSGPLALEFSSVFVEGALHDVTFVAKPAERVLVTGPTGAGKSTLLALAARLIDPDAGEVRLDGQPLRALALDSVHEAVQLVSPELPLVHGSVAENVSYGASGDDADWLEAVALACGLANDAALPEGLATRVDERGANLSAGLRARIALARAVAMRPRLLLVDDPAFAGDEAARAALVRVLALHPTTAVVVGAEDPLAMGLTRTWQLDGGRASGARS
jgi:ABC-type multidrug transport system fused ATPase/permease subunit